MTSSEEALTLLIPKDIQTHIDFRNKYRSSIKGVILKDLNRLKKHDELLARHCDNCPNKEGKICVGMNAPISIETLISCKECFITDCEMGIEELKKENEDLKLQNFNQHLFLNGEIDKLKKVIEILEDKFNLEIIDEELHFDFSDCDTRDHDFYDELFYNLTKEESKLLKEVLKCCKK